MTAPPRPIPRPCNGLTARQVRGHNCVWCGSVLDVATAAEVTAVDLPAQPFRIHDHVTRWYPHSSTGCAP